MAADIVGLQFKLVLDGSEFCKIRHQYMHQCAVFRSKVDDISMVIRVVAKKKE